MTILEIMSLVIQQIFAQCNKQNHFMNVLCDMQSVFKINNKDVRVASADVILMSVLTQFSPFHKLFRDFFIALTKFRKRKMLLKMSISRRRYRFIFMFGSYCSTTVNLN